MPWPCCHAAPPCALNSLDTPPAPPPSPPTYTLRSMCGSPGKPAMQPPLYMKQYSCIALVQCSMIPSLQQEVTAHSARWQQRWWRAVALRCRWHSACCRWARGMTLHPSQASPRCAVVVITQQGGEYQSEEGGDGKRLLTRVLPLPQTSQPLLCVPPHPHRTPRRPYGWP
jgi:hypothetical protein